MGVNRAGLVTAALLALPASALWDTAGHRTVAAIAWEHMTPRARARAVELLLHGPSLANFASLRPAGGVPATRSICRAMRIAYAMESSPGSGATASSRMRSQ